MIETDVKSYWEQRLGQGPTLETVGYRALGKQFNAWMYRVRRAIFLRRVRAALRRYGIEPSRARALDVGSGSGFYIDRWKELRARSITGVDLTHASVRALSRKYPDVEFRQVDIGAPNPPLASSAYELVSCMDVLFHIVDDEKYAAAIGALAQAVAPGGLVILTENCIEAKTQRSAYQTSRSRAEIHRLLERCGLEVVERRPVFALMNAPIDSPHVLLHASWRVVCALAARAEAFGWVLGALLYGPELLLTHVLHEGPSTEMLICRRVTPS